MTFCRMSRALLGQMYGLGSVFEWSEAQQAELTRRISENRLRRGEFKSLPELVTAIDDHVAHHNTDPKPFIWTKSARDILLKVIRADARFCSKQSGTLH